MVTTARSFAKEREVTLEPGVISVVRRKSKTSSVSSVGWQPTDEMAYPEWEAQGRWLGSISRCSQWWIGDWVRFGAARYGEKYSEASALTGYDEHSLRNIAYVASRFPELSRRRDKLSFSHHAELAPLPPEEQEEWLRRVEHERLSVASLRKALREHRAAGRELAARQAGEQALVAEHDAASDEELVCCPSCGHRFQVGERT